MRVVIDMQGMQTGSAARGIGRYTSSLVQEILSSQRQHEYILVLNGLFADSIARIRTQFDGIIDQKNIRVWNAVGPVYENDPANAPRQAVARRMREAFIKRLEPDIVLITSLVEGYGDNFIGSVHEYDKETPVAAIFYDLIPYLYPELYLADKGIADWYQNRIEQLKKVDLFLCISESSKCELIEHLSVRDDKTANISAASDHRFYVEPISEEEKEKFLSQFGLNKPYLTYLSATDRRKNHIRLIEAYSKLPKSVRSQNQLCFAGYLPEEHKNEFYAAASKYGLKKHELVLTGQVSDEEINKLLNLTQAFVFPSYHEGFGLPVLEAMQCGCAVIGANTSSVPEVIGRADALFDPFNVDEMCLQIHRVLTDEQFRDDLKAHGSKQVLKFSWEKSAALAVKTIESHVAKSANSVVDSNKSTQEECTDQLVQHIAPYCIDFNEKDLRGTAHFIARNEREASKPQLLVDISELVQNDFQTGIQRVVRNILFHWLTNPPKGFDVKPVYAGVNHSYKYAETFTSKFITGDNIQCSDPYVEYGSNDIFVGLDLIHPDIARSNNKAYLLMKEIGVKMSFVVYDILPIQFPQFFGVGALEVFTRWLDLISKSDNLFCISKATANDLNVHLIKNYGETNVPSINWFHLGADLENNRSISGSVNDEPISSKEFDQRKTFLMVGTLEPRKSHAQVLDAFERAWALGIDINLVIVGKQGWQTEAFIERLRDHVELNKRLVWLEAVSDEYLEKAYAVSHCLIAASEGEGFGLPLIEAAQHELPIIARDIPVFREVAGDHAFYFENSKDAQVITNSIIQWLELDANAQSPQTVNMPHLSWAESAQQLLDLVTSNKQQANK